MTNLTFTVDEEVLRRGVLADVATEVEPQGRYPGFGQASSHPGEEPAFLTGDTTTMD